MYQYPPVLGFLSAYLPVEGSGIWFECIVCVRDIVSVSHFSVQVSTHRQRTSANAWFLSAVQVQCIPSLETMCGRIQLQGNIEL